LEINKKYFNKKYSIFMLEKNYKKEVEYDLKYLWN